MPAELSTATLRVHGLTGIPAVHPGMDLAQVLADAIRRAELRVAELDVLVVTQKIVSKSEGRIVRLSEVRPSPRAEELAGRLGKDPRKIEVILRQTRRIVREGPEVLICETHGGQVCANAGVDESNLDDPDSMLLQPENPDASAEHIRRGLAARLGVSPGVVISDSYGRPWRLGLVNVAIGVAGCPVLEDLRGKPDTLGKPLTSTILAVADEMAAFAGLVMGKLERIPAALIQGFTSESPRGRAADLVRPPDQDLFR